MFTGLRDANDNSIKEAPNTVVNIHFVILTESTTLIFSKRFSSTAGRPHLLSVTDKIIDAALIERTNAYSPKMQKIILITVIINFIFKKG